MPYVICSTYSQNISAVRWQVSVIRLFLSSFEEHGEFLGVPSLGVIMQTSENAAMKSKFGLEAGGHSGGTTSLPLPACVARFALLTASGRQAGRHLLMPLLNQRRLLRILPN